jgi:transcriptional regulator with XRE-family HTH domain
MEAEKNFRKVRIGANLRRLRLDAKLSQRQVADYLTEKSPSGAVVLREHVSVWEQGNKEPLGGTVERLADLFQCDPGEFYRPLNGTGTPAD